MPELTLYQMSIYTTALLAIAFMQLFLIASGTGWIGNFSLPARRRLITAHRFGGYIGLFIILLVSYTCVVYIGVTLSPFRVAVHSVVGTVMIVAIICKILITRGVPRLYLSLPMIGAILFTTIIITWLNSAGWYFYYVGF